MSKYKMLCWRRRLPEAARQGAAKVAKQQLFD